MIHSNSSAPILPMQCYKQPYLELYNSDCQIGMKEIADNSINCILTDPPYLYLKNQKLERKFDEQLFFSECKRILKNDGFIVLFGRGASFYRWNTILADLGFLFKEEIIWDKMRITSPTNNLGRMHETIAIWTKGDGIINKVKNNFIESYKYDPKKIVDTIYRLTTTFGNRKTFELVKKYFETGAYSHDEGSKRRFNTTLKNDIKKTNRTLQFAVKMEEGVLEKSIIKETHDRNTIHPTQKPLKLLERLLALTTIEKDLVLDAFSGSGSTALACWNTGRKFVGYEIDEAYYNASVKRIKKETSSPELFC